MTKSSEPNERRANTFSVTEHRERAFAARARRAEQDDVVLIVKLLRIAL